MVTSAIMMLLRVAVWSQIAEVFLMLLVAGSPLFQPLAVPPLVWLEMVLNRSFRPLAFNLPWTLPSAKDANTQRE